MAQVVRHDRLINFKFYPEKKNITREEILEKQYNASGIADGAQGYVHYFAK